MGRKHVHQLQPVLPRSVPGFPAGTSGSCACFPSLLCMGRKGRKGAASFPAQQHACQLPTAASATRTRSSLPPSSRAGSPWGTGSHAGLQGTHSWLSAGCRRQHRTARPKAPGHGAAALGNEPDALRWFRALGTALPPLLPTLSSGSRDDPSPSSQKPGWGSSHFFFAECTESIFSLLNHLIFLAPIPIGILSFFCINSAQFQR